VTILHIHDRAGRYGGGEVYLAQLRAGLRLQGHQCPVLYLTPTGSECDPGEEMWCERKPHGLFSGFGMRRWLEPLLETIKPDVVHCHCLFSPVSLAWLCKRVPTVFTLHSLHLLPRRSGCEPMTALGQYERLLRRVMRPALRRLASWIAPSEAFAEEIRGEGYQRVTVVPHFTDKRPSSRDDRTEGETILFVGRLSAEKGIEVFLDALPLLRAQSWRAVVIGEGPLEAPAKQRVVQEGLADRVRFAGWLSGADLDREYERAAVLAVPSTVKEAFGLVGIEAMAFGKPVVAFDAGGIREWLQDGKTGYLVRQGDPSDLATRIDEVLQHPERARAMGEAGQRLVEERFRVAPHIHSLLRVYEKAARNGSMGAVPEAYAYRN